MGPQAGCGLVAAITFEPREIITAYHGELIWMPAVTAKASMTSDNHSHFKRISGTDFVIAGFPGREIKFGSGGGSVANCANRKCDANARLVTLYEKKHEDFMWCGEMSRYERVSGTFLVATKHIGVNDEILTWYGSATRQRLGLDTVTVSEDVSELSANELQSGSPEVLFDTAGLVLNRSKLIPHVYANGPRDKELMVPVYVWNHILKTARGAVAFTAQARFEDAKSKTEAEILSQELDAFVQAYTVSRLIGNPLMSDLSLRLCALCILGNPEFEDPHHWFSDCPDAKWGAMKVSLSIALIKKARGVQTVDNLVDKVVGIRVQCNSRHEDGDMQPPQTHEPPSRVGSERFDFIKFTNFLFAFVEQTRNNVCIFISETIASSE